MQYFLTNKRIILTTERYFPVQKVDDPYKQINQASKESNGKTTN